MLPVVAMLIWLFARPWLPRRVGLAADGVLLICWVLANQQDLLRPQIFHWKQLPLYLMAGILLYSLSCLITGVSIKFQKSVRHRPALNDLWWWRIVLISPLYEEAVWRLAAQELLVWSLAEFSDIGFTLVLILIPVSFTVWHRTVWSRPQHAFELIIFSFVLSASIVLWGDLLFSVCLHVMRNFLILQRPAENEIS